MTAPLPSYTSATATHPLLGDTIGDTLARTAAKFPDRTVLVDVAAGKRYTYAQFAGRDRRAGTGPARRRRRDRRPGRHLGAQLCRVDDHPVCHRQDRRDPGQHQPGVPHPRARVRAQPVDASACWSRRPGSRPAITRPWSTRSLPGAPRCAGSCTSVREFDALVDAGRGGDVSTAWPTSAAGRSADQHPIHLRYHRIPEGRHAFSPQHRQQRLLRRARLRLHRAGRDLRAGAAVPLLRHGDGQPRGDLVRRLCRLSGAGVRPSGDPASGAGRDGARRCTGCRRCSSQNWRWRTSTTTTCRASAPGSWPARRARWR